jgi:arylsulfatase A-like enzyme/Flp pilus assembly protein TadD
VRKSVIVLFVLVAGCGKNASVASSNHTPVILISVDTLRSDHLPAYGYRGVETPNIDRFCRDAILFEHAYSHVPLTLPSHATMLTGRLPADTGIRDNLGFTLDEKVATLPELLKRNGYDTGAAVSAFVLHRETGISRGFDFYDDNIEIDAHSLSRSQRDGSRTIAIAENWIKPRKERPFLFFLHLYEPHSPYEPPERFRKYASLYDGEIAYVDEILGGFFEFLKQNRVYDKALIIFVSDHGEGLGDHGEQEHGILLYREEIQVPLLVKLPGNAMSGRSVAVPVQLIDLVPTIANQTRTDVASLKLPGQSLLSVTAVRHIYSETYYPRFYFGWSDLHSLIDSDHHYIRAPSQELYDVVHDPAERHNVASDDRRTLNARREEIASFIHGPTQPTFDAESAKKIASLGYLGTANASAEEGPLPDPKDRLPTVANLKNAMLAFEQKQFADADRLLRPLLRENPRMPYAWNVEAKALVALGRLPEALEAAKTALRLAPGANDIAIEVAEIALQLGRFDEARQHAELARRDMPERSGELLARIALAKGDLRTALANATHATEFKNNRDVSFVTLGNVQRAMKDYPASIVSFDKALAAARGTGAKPIINTYAWRGDSLARRDRTPEAENAFREEIALYPSNPEPYRYLILLYASEGKPQDAARVVYELERAAPVPSSYVAIASALDTIGDKQGARFWQTRGLRAFPGDATLRRLSK